MGGLLTGSKEQASGFRRIVFLLVSLVIVPTAFLLALGILMLVFYEAQLNVVFGILVVAFVGCTVVGTVLTLVFLRKEANLSRLQTDFVSKVSHELRTPLTSIRLFVETLQAKRVSHPEQVDACLEVLAKETNRLTDRIERLLDWGRMEAGKRIYDRKRESVDDIVRDSLAAFESATVGRKTEVAVDVADDLPTVHADRAALVDALLNLLANSYKYSGDDRRIAITARADNGMVRLSVSDNGIGIPHREHRRVFEKFYRVDERLTQAREGSGLGLAIVRHVVRAHGGTIELESEPGKGSEFTIALPSDDEPPGERRAA